MYICPKCLVSLLEKTQHSTDCSYKDQSDQGLNCFAKTFYKSLPGRTNARLESKVFPEIPFRKETSVHVFPYSMEKKIDTSS